MLLKERGSFESVNLASGRNTSRMMRVLCGSQNSPRYCTRRVRGGGGVTDGARPFPSSPGIPSRATIDVAVGKWGQRQRRPDLRLLVAARLLHWRLSGGFCVVVGIFTITLGRTKLEILV